MRPTQPALKRAQDYTWDMASADDRPSEFASSGLKRDYEWPSEFARSSFMDAAPDRPGRRRRRARVRLLRVSLLGTLCIVVMLGAVAFWQGLLA